MLGWLNPIGALFKELAAGYRAREEAKTDRERIAADKHIEEVKGQIDLAKAAAEHDKWWSPRTIMAYSAAAYVFKIVVYDTVLGAGVTPDPGPQVTGIVMVVVGFYFGSKAVSDLGAKLLSAFKR